MFLLEIYLINFRICPNESNITVKNIIMKTTTDPKTDTWIKHMDCIMNTWNKKWKLKQSGIKWRQ